MGRGGLSGDISQARTTGPGTHRTSQERKGRIRRNEIATPRAGKRNTEAERNQSEVSRLGDPEPNGTSATRQPFPVCVCAILIWKCHLELQGPRHGSQYQEGKTIQLGDNLCCFEERLLCKVATEPRGQGDPRLRGGQTQCTGGWAVPAEPPKASALLLCTNSNRGEPGQEGDGSVDWKGTVTKCDAERPK